MANIILHIAPDVAQLLGPSNEVSIRSAIQAQAPPCTKCGDRISLEDAAEISVIVHLTPNADHAITVFAHADCAPSTVEIGEIDMDRIHDKMSQYDVAMLDVHFCLVAIREPWVILTDHNGTSRNQTDLLAQGYHRISGEFPVALTAPPLPGWSRRINKDRLEIITDTAEVVDSWPLEHITEERALSLPLILLVAERIGLPEMHIDRIALTVHAGDAVGGTIPPTTNGRARRSALDWLLRKH